jgi:hypothetical protein
MLMVTYQHLTPYSYLMLIAGIPAHLAVPAIKHGIGAKTAAINIVPIAAKSALKLTAFSHV